MSTSGVKTGGTKPCCCLVLSPAERMTTTSHFFMFILLVNRPMYKCTIPFLPLIF